MSANAPELERIVREVLARLGASAPTETRESQAAGDGGTWVLDGRLVTVATVEGRTAGVRRIEVAANAIVTPAARDYLADRGIEIERRSAQEDAPMSRGLLVGVADAVVEPSQWLKTGFGTRIEFEQVARTGLVDVVDALADGVARDGRAGLLFTEQPEAALCLANRQRGVRAVWGMSVDRVERARRLFAANLLVVEPSTQGPFMVRRMASALMAAGTYTCAGVLRTRLQ